MAANQFQVLLQTLKDLRTEAEATVRALRQLEGQSGPMGPAGNSRTAYVRGVEQANASTPHARSVGNLMPISAGAGAFAGSISGGGGGGGSRGASSWVPLTKADKARMDNLIASKAMLSKWSGQRLQDEMFDQFQGLSGMSLKQYEINRIGWGTSPLVQPSHIGRGATGSSWFNYLRTQQNAIFGSNVMATGASFPSLNRLSSTGPYYGRDQDLNRIDRRTSIYPLRRTQMSGITGGKIGGSPYFTGRGFNVFNPPPSPFKESVSQFYDQIGRGTGLAVMGAGMATIAIREAMRTGDSIHRERYSAGGEGDQGQYSVGGGRGYNTTGGMISNFAEGFGLAAQRSLPAMGSVALSMWGGQKLGSMASAAQATFRAATVKGGAHAGIRAGVRAAFGAVGGVGGAVSTLGVGAIFYAALDQAPNAMETAKLMFIEGSSPIEYEKRKQAHDLSKLRMFQHIRNNMPGRQGMTGGMDYRNSVAGGEIEQMIQEKADQLATRSSGFMDISIAFGGHENVLRNFMATFGLAKGREELRQEAIKEYIRKDEKVEEARKKGWEYMELGDFSRARTNYSKAYDMSPWRRQVEAWLNPLTIYTEIQSARINSRHYAASFITRPIQRTGD
jgi:hypothetical protein